MSVIHAPRKPELDLRVLLFPVAMVLLLVVLLLRLWYVQVVLAPALQEKAEASRIVVMEKLAPRGLVYDRRGALVAGIRPEIVVTAKPRTIAENKWVVAEVAKMLGADPEKLNKKVNDSNWRPYLPTPIFVGTDIKTGTRIAEAGEDLPGIGVETQPMRFYPESKGFTHVLGYVWTPDEGDVKRIKDFGGSPATYVGKSGIERAYEEALMGAPGKERLEVDAKRRPLRVAGRDASTAGNQLILSLDGRLQKYATQLMADKGFRGGIAAIDPTNGEVLCLVSSPTYDINLFTGGISTANYQALLNHPGKPLYNRALRSSYAPGSTFKLVTTIAGLQAGKFSPNATYYCAGGVRVGRRLFKCLGTHGAISFHRAMSKSCNSYFYQLGKAVGEESLRKASLDVGLGQKTGLETGGEVSGVVPTADWIKKHKSDGKWYGGDTLNFAIGQGFLSTTPLQMANVAALVANNGINYRPHLVRAIKDSTGTETIKREEPQVLHKIEASPAFWAGMKSALVAVIEDGTARSAQIPGIRWGGKTGSAEHNASKQTHGWFVGFAPADNPKIAICVLVEAAGHGGDVAAPIAKEIVKRYLTPDKAPSKPATKASASAALAASPASR